MSGSPSHDCHDWICPQLLQLPTLSLESNSLDALRSSPVRPRLPPKSCHRPWANSGYLHAFISVFTPKSSLLAAPHNGSTSVITAGFDPENAPWHQTTIREVRNSIQVEKFQLEVTSWTLGQEPIELVFRQSSAIPAWKKSRKSHQKRYRIATVAVLVLKASTWCPRHFRL